MIFLNFLFIFRLLGTNNNKKYFNNSFKLNNNNEQYFNNEIFNMTNITNITNKNNDEIMPIFFNISDKKEESISSTIINYGKYLNSSNEFIHFIFFPKESNNNSSPESNESNISKIYNNNLENIKNKELQYAGFDMRYSNMSLEIEIEIEIEKNNLISKIHENLYKKNILDSLQRNISINTKLEILEKYNRLNKNNIKHGINIIAGNLYKDWNLDEEFEN
jgi:hypothetical protein